MHGWPFGDLTFRAGLRFISRLKIWRAAGPRAPPTCTKHGSPFARVPRNPLMRAHHVFDCSLFAGCESPSIGTGGGWSRGRIWTGHAQVAFIPRHAIPKSEVLLMMMMILLELISWPLPHHQVHRYMYEYGRYIPNYSFGPAIRT